MKVGWIPKEIMAHKSQMNKLSVTFIDYEWSNSGKRLFTNINIVKMIY